MKTYKPIEPREWGQVEIAWAGTAYDFEDEGLIRFADGHTASLTRVTVQRTIPVANGPFAYGRTTYRFRGVEYDTLDEAITAAFKTIRET